MARRQYTEDEKATALTFVAAMDGNVAGAAKKLKMPRVTLMKWVKGRGVNSAVLQKEQVKKEHLADLWEYEARAALEEAKLARDDARYGELILGGATATDKMRLIRGEPTAINKHEHAIPGEDAILAAAEEIRFRRLVGDAGTGIPSGVHEGDLSEI